MASNNKIYFIGIGGIGISALAQWYKARDYKVFGSDSTRSKITDLLKGKGIKVHIGTNPKNVTKDINLVIYSLAVPESHPERKRAKKFGVPQKSYAEALGEITKLYKTIAVCGTHGKSTTTAMTSLVLKEAGFDPTVIIGTLVPQFGYNNFRRGNSEWLVIEADEYREAFLNHHPFITVATNVDADHLDYYKTLTSIKRAFKKFFKKNRQNGFLLLNKEDKFLAALPKRTNAPIYYYSVDKQRARELKKILKVPGRHNLANAMAADTLGQLIGIDAKTREKALSKFTGTWRRFEYRGKINGAKIFDDYGHHPAEIRATLQAAREAYPDKIIWCIFQPHQTERLTKLFDDFAKAFRDADNIGILETYKVRGREYKGKKRTARELAEKIGAFYFSNHEEVIKFMQRRLKSQNIAILMGAGDINLITDKIFKRRHG